MMNPYMQNAEDDIIDELADAADMIVNDCAQNSPATTANRRYKKAYGNYQGGYGPGGGYGPSGGYSGSQWSKTPLKPPPPPLIDFGSGPMDFGPRPEPNFDNYGPGGPEANYDDYGPGSYGGYDDYGYDEGPPKYVMGRGYGPLGPGGPAQPRRNTDLINKVNKYLIRCGMGKNDLKNLPDEFYSKIEPEYCHICAVEFDTFSISRMHYVSKNHLKKQKRWVAQYDESPRSGKKNMPMKSRDLYCELCDVEITSKVHAESHYAGKPHRAIIDGRRNPKNPLLLEKGMESRINQLINREKKFLKKMAEAAPEEQETAAATTPAKPVPPELHCEICNTSVTCTEQMAMHRNGKRHLAKEKNYIMRYMKGEAPPKESQGNMQTEDNGNGNQDAENAAAADDEWATIDGTTAAEW